jgi:hypothetical protein
MSQSIINRSDNLFTEKDVRLDGEADLQATFWTRAKHLPTGIVVVSDSIGGEIDKTILLRKLETAIIEAARKWVEYQRG